MKWLSLPMLLLRGTPAEGREDGMAQCLQSKQFCPASSLESGLEGCSSGRGRFGDGVVDFRLDEQEEVKPYCQAFYASALENDGLRSLSVHPGAGPSPAEGGWAECNLHELRAGVDRRGRGQPKAEGGETALPPCEQRRQGHKLANTQPSSTSSGEGLIVNPAIQDDVNKRIARIASKQMLKGSKQ